MYSWDRAVAAPSPSGFVWVAKEPARLHFAKGSSRSRGRKNRNRPNDGFSQKPESFQVGRVGRAFHPELARTEFIRTPRLRQNERSPNPLRSDKTDQLEQLNSGLYESSVQESSE